MLDILQTIFSGSALVLGFMYIIGGLIVNLNLTRRGVTEYQILKVKYLVVGLIFSLQSVGIFVFAAIPAFFLLSFGDARLLVQLLNIISMLAAVSLILIWARLPRETPSMLGQWRFWFLASAAAALFPMMILLRQILVPAFDAYTVILTAQAVMGGALAFIAQIYHYSVFYYGRAKPAGALDPIGVGIPTTVQIACSEGNGRLLQGLGAPMAAADITGEVLLIDETGQQYIIGLKQEDGEGTAEKTLKISKEMVKAILYKPEHMRQIGGAPPQGEKGEGG